jgi:hypothetical protein
MCGEDAFILESHHACPRFVGGDERDIIQVCKKCHTLADKKMRFFLTHPFGAAPKWVDKNKIKVRLKDYSMSLKVKNFIGLLCGNDVYIQIKVRYNLNTHHIGIYSHFMWNHKKRHLTVSAIPVPKPTVPGGP